MHILGILLFTLVASVPVPVRGLLSQTFRKFSSMKIDSRTMLTTYNSSLAKDSACAWKCNALGPACFAAQYDWSNNQCQLQLNCGTVALVSASSNYVVFVSHTVVYNNAASVRPFIYFPLVYGCLADLSSSYGSSNAAFSLATANVIGAQQNSYSALASTIAMTSGSFSQVSVQDTSLTGAFNVFGGPFTIAFFIQITSPVTEFAPISFMTAGLGNTCFNIRFIDTNNNIFFWSGNCGCTSSSSSCWQPFKYSPYWTHVALTYASGVFTWYFNGTAANVCQNSFTPPTGVPTRLVVGSINECTNWWRNFAPPGSIACVAIYTSALDPKQAMASYLQCLYGGLFI